MTYRCKHLIIGRFIARFHETASTTIFDTIVENLLTFSRIHKHFCVCQYKQRTRNSLVDDNESISFRHLRRRRLFEIQSNRKTIPHLDRWFSPNESNRWRKKKKRKSLLEIKQSDQRSQFTSNLFLASTNPSKVPKRRCTLRLP